jgi:phosphoglucomutase
MSEQLAAMSANIGKLNSKIERAVADGQLMEPAAKNIRTLLAGAPSDLYLCAVEELVDSSKWSEVNDRFYQTLAFGTGGIRGRTIGKIVTKAERGNSHEDQRPEFPCVGTNAMNFFNISRATRGLVAYLHDWNRLEKISAKPKIVIAYDPRFFSKGFAGLAAKVASENGCDAFVFEGPPQVIIRHTIMGTRFTSAMERK